MSISTSTAHHFLTDCGRGFIFDMSNYRGLIPYAGGAFFVFHNGQHGERRQLDISEKYIGARKTMKGAKVFLARVMSGRAPLVYIPYPSIPIKGA